MRVFQNNFSGGEISPAMYSRLDLAKYATGCKEALNGIVLPHGGITKRPGLHMVDELRIAVDGDSVPVEDAYIVSFTYRVDEAFVLVFYDAPAGSATPGKMRIFTHGGTVMDGDTPYVVDCPYTLEQIRDSETMQSADTLFIAHPDHPPRRLVRYGNTDWRFEDLVFHPGITPPTTVSTAYSQGWVPTPYKNISYKVSAVNASGEESYPSEEASIGIPATWTQGGYIIVSWSAVTGADRYNIYKNERGFYGWIGTVDGTQTSFNDDNIRPDGGDGPKNAGLDFSLMQPPSSVELARDASDTGPATVTVRVRVAVATSEYDESNASTEETIKAGAEYKKAVTVTVASGASGVAGAKYVVYYKFDSATEWTRGVRLVSESSAPFTLNVLTQEDGDGPYDKRGVYPGVVGMFQQRLVFARSDEKPQTVWCSQPGALNNFSTSYPLKDTDAIEAQLDSRQMNEIRHLYLLKNIMVVFTAGAEFLMGPGRNNDAITPSAISFEAQSFYGCSKVPPLQAGGGLLMLQNSGKIVRDLYSTYTNEYEGNEVSIMAEHLFPKPVIDWAWQEEPYHTAYAVREDGVLLSFTYLREQQLSSWSHHTTPNGKFRSVGCISEDDTDRIYTVVKRTVGGETKCFVEYMDTREYGSPVEESFFVDCGLEFSWQDIDPDTGEPWGERSIITGLDHLKGEKVVALVDGGVEENLEVFAEDTYVGSVLVPAGAVLLPAPAKIAKIGLPYTMRITTLDPELNAQTGSTTGMKKNAVRARLRVRDARGFFVGPEDGPLALVKFPLADDLGGVPELWVGDVETVLYGRHRSEASVTIEHRDPLPATLLSLNLTINSES